MRIWLQSADARPLSPVMSRPHGANSRFLSREQALQRELQEELGITIGPAVLWKVETVDYPHALVRLNFCKVFGWIGDLQMREAQSCSWQRLPVQVAPLLPGTVPVLQWLADEWGSASVI